MSTTAILRFLGWSYLPDFATKQLLRVLHYSTVKIFRTPVPAPRTPLYITHYRLTFALVVLGYLTYNLIDASTSLPPNFYELLGVNASVDESELKAAFRAFARRFHPDRVGPQGEALFIEVRDAFEALKDPVVRFAYDRFGPDVLRWKDCTTMWEYLRHGLMSSSGFHIMTGLGLFLFSMIGRSSPVAFWRYVVFLVLLVSELCLLVTPPSPPSLPVDDLFVDHMTSKPPLLSILFPRRVAYQHINLLHQLCIFLSVALSRVAPVLFPPVTQGDLGMDMPVVKGMTDRLAGLTAAADRELSMLLNLELQSIHNNESSGQTNTSSVLPSLDEGSMDQLSMEMENIIIESKLKADVGPLRSAWENAIKRRRDVSC